MQGTLYIIIPRILHTSSYTSYRLSPNNVLCCHSNERMLAIRPLRPLSFIPTHSSFSIQPYFRGWNPPHKLSFFHQILPVFDFRCYNLTQLRKSSWFEKLEWTIMDSTDVWSFVNKVNYMKTNDLTWWACMNSTAVDVRPFAYDEQL